MDSSLSEKYAIYILLLIKAAKDKNDQDLKSAIISLLDEYEQMLNKRGSDLFQPEKRIFYLEKKYPD